MAVEERAEKQVFGSTGRREYWIKGASSADDARTQLLGDAPATWEAGGRTLYRDGKSCEVFEIGDLWFGVAHYAEQSEAEEGGGGDDSTFSFDTTGETEHILTSLSTVGAYPVAGPAAADVDDNGNLIRVTPDGVDGIERTIARFAFTITKSFDIADVSAAYITSLIALTGKVNVASFTVTTDDGLQITLNAAECLFFGASGGTRNGRVDITFYFAGSPNRTGITVGTIAGIAAKGWEYIWVRYTDDKVGGLKVMGKKPIAVYVERVYDVGDFSLLGL